MKNKIRKESMEILIPAHDEEGNIEIVVRKSLNWLKQHTKDYRVLVVNDGSTDGTGEILINLSVKEPHLEVIHHRANLGIGKALRTLYKNAKKEYLFTCPADQQFDPEEFSSALKYMKQVHIISFYRTKKIDYNLFRNIISFGNRMFNRIFFKLKIKDVNWVKMYKRNLLEDLDLKSETSLLETEILAKAKKKGKKIIELPSIQHKRVYGRSEGSGRKNILQVIKDLIKVYRTVKKFK